MDNDIRDRQEIENLLYRYARAVDTDDWEGYVDVFTEDAVLDYSSAGYPPGDRHQMAAVFGSTLSVLTMKQHFVTNVQVELDGDRAKVTAMFVNPMQFPGLDGLSICGGNYHHTVVRTPDGWRSERLVEENLWFVNRPPRPAATAGAASSA
ncbi:nuclear transport factor 2 family protein [Rhodococcus sp. NPDC003322]